nr:hypothetical protein [Tanacetum cinerariifolium]
VAAFFRSEEKSRWKVAFDANSLRKDGIWFSSDGLRVLVDNNQMVAVRGDDVLKKPPTEAQLAKSNTMPENPAKPTLTHQVQDALHQLAESTLRNTPFHWGVQALQIDEEALANGSLQLKRLKLVFPDGTLFDAPQHDPLPAARDLRELLKGNDFKVYAALKLPEPFGLNYVED